VEEVHQYRKAKIMDDDMGLIMIDDRGMVDAVLAGEREAYRRLVEKYQGMVFAAISRITGSRPEVEDLAQETFWQAYRSLSRFRGEARFSTWLLRIAVNKAIDYHRRRCEEKKRLEGYVRQLAVQSKLEEVPEGIVLAREQRERLYSHLDRLPYHYRYVLKRHYLDGFTYREMAFEAGVPLKTIESRIYRARKIMRDLWLEEEEYGLFETRQA
jgi:RNA polymerase sigma factor (sigma-70 family)